MPRYVGFLRAVNVGGRVVKMERLRQLFEETGFTGVSTHLASGNVLFTAGRGRSATHEAKLERALGAGLGWEVATFLRTPAEMAAVVERLPFPAEDVATAHAVYVGFLKAPPAPEAHALLHGLRTPTDALEVHGREVYWLCRVRTAASELSGASLEKALKLAATFRNMTTVRAVAAKLAL
ncbi:MAG TPA: DUF1697 domain-containing protein [Thermoanaerobaculia bacterium]|nr:DUF1697 domain-containing protein [Thermoanaerobaculia bacterium]